MVIILVVLSLEHQLDRFISSKPSGRPACLADQCAHLAVPEAHDSMMSVDSTNDT